MRLGAERAKNAATVGYGRYAEKDTPFDTSTARKTLSNRREYANPLGIVNPTW